MALLDGRVVIVTGGGQGLGRSHCLELATHGAVVVVNDLGTTLSGESSGSRCADEVASEIRASGGQAMADTTSVTDFVGVEGLVARTVEKYGRLDVIVNNAGITRDRMITSMTETDFDSVLSVHLKGTWCMIRHACSYWRDRAKAGHETGGRIINTTSGTGLFGNIGQANYGAAKAGIANLTIIAAMEMQRYGVTSNAISPIARTRMTSGLGGMADTPPGEWDPYDPANASPVVAWLASTYSGWLTGAVLRIDGYRVSNVSGWEIDGDATYLSPDGRRVDANKLDGGLRAAFRVAPRGMPAGAITNP